MHVGLAPETLALCLAPVRARCTLAALPASPLPCEPLEAIAPSPDSTSLSETSFVLFRSPVVTSLLAGLSHPRSEVLSSYRHRSNCEGRDFETPPNGFFASENTNRSPRPCAVMRVVQAGLRPPRDFVTSGESPLLARSFSSREEGLASRSLRGSAVWLGDWCCVVPPGPWAGGHVSPVVSSAGLSRKADGLQR